MYGKGGNPLLKSNMSHSQLDFDFQQIIEGSLDTNIILDNRIVVYANKACINLLGLKQKENIIGKNFDQFLHPDFHSICRQRLKRVIGYKEHAPVMEQKMIRMDGRIIDVEIMAIPYMHRNNKLMAQIVIRDITEAKKTQQLIMQKEKLSVIGELASGIVHDIRNPITSIKGFLQLLNTEFSNNRYFNIIHSEITQIEHIANELLYLAKPKETDFKVELLAEIIEESLALFGTEAFKRKINIYFKPEKYRALFVRGDKVQLKQVFVNLIKNAIEAIDKKGTIYIKIDYDATNIFASIVDNGIGIPADKIHKIGQSFFTDKTEGTGLGLMVTHHIITNHNGKIIVDSKEGIGTTFTIQLPIANIK
ncbi:MAG: PAS domain S-box protein [Bacillus sp. (in: Bacteria)]|nr:PAS domain S-box protein [Bacillus sp. (in: firmicutes)]